MDLRYRDILTWFSNPCGLDVKHFSALTLFPILNLKTMANAPDNENMVPILLSTFFPEEKFFLFEKHAEGFCNALEKSVFRGQSVQFLQG